MQTFFTFEHITHKNAFSFGLPGRLLGVMMHGREGGNIKVGKHGDVDFACLVISMSFSAGHHKDLERPGQHHPSPAPLASL